MIWYVVGFVAKRTLQMRIKCTIRENATVGGLSFYKEYTLYGAAVESIDRPIGMTCILQWIEPAP
jgi:hypothetical protein